MAVNRAAQGGGRRGGSYGNGHHHSATNGHDAYYDMGSPKEKKIPFGMARRKRLRCLAFVAIVVALVLFIAVPRVLLDSLWTEENPEEQGRQRAARQLSALTVTDSQGKRKFVTDPSRTTFTRRNAKPGGSRATGIQMEGGIGVRGDNDIPEEIAGEKVEGRMKPLVERAALARRRRRGAFTRRSTLEKVSEEAYLLGKGAVEEVEAEMQRLEELRREGRRDVRADLQARAENATCPQSIFLTGEQVEAAGRKVVLPCGLRVGATITYVGSVVVPGAGVEAKGEEGNESVVQFKFELQGLPVVPGEQPTRIYHLVADMPHPFVVAAAAVAAAKEKEKAAANAGAAARGGTAERNKKDGGEDDDESGMPTPSLSVNTCYRGRWGLWQKCNGSASGDREERVDGHRRCEKWAPEKWERGNTGPKEREKPGTKAQEREQAEEWPFPIPMGRLFVFVLRAGWEGFHLTIDGVHAASFQYRSGNPLEEATSVVISGNLVLQSLVATSLPKRPPLLKAQLDSSLRLRAPPLNPDGHNASLFIGVLSATNHFAERTAVRRTWMQHPQIRSGEVVVRFFLALHPSIQVNVEVRKESDLYGDMVVLPFIDRYDLVVLKTIAICEYGLRNLSTPYIMKADDDNFVRLDAVLDELHFAGHTRGLYMGNINEFHKPLREGKWAVTEEEWPETNYPPYANGPGYIITRDIADFISRMKALNMLRIFKMEDVSMGMWVVQYGINNTVHYVHNWRFCQAGCMEDYLSAHYQSPRQMQCMWAKLLRGDFRCCG